MESPAQATEQTIGAHLYAVGTLSALRELYRDRGGGGPVRVVFDLSFSREAPEIWLGAAGAAPTLGFRFTSEDRALAFFEGRSFRFRPVGAWWRPLRAGGLLLLLRRLGTLLRSEKGDAERKGRLLMAFMRPCLELLPMLDPEIRKVVRGGSKGVVWFRGPEGTVLLGLVFTGSSLRVVEAMEFDLRRVEPSVSLVFTNWRSGLAILRNRLDPQLAINLGELRVVGHIPLADQAGLLLDRLTRFVKP